MNVNFKPNISNLKRVGFSGIEIDDSTPGKSDYEAALKRRNIKEISQKLDTQGWTLKIQPAEEDRGLLEAVYSHKSGKKGSEIIAIREYCTERPARIINEAIGLLNIFKAQLKNPKKPLITKR
jgi:hypothetical protein